MARAWKCGAPDWARAARLSKPAVGSEISKIMVSGMAKTVKWRCSGAQYFKICEIDMLRERKFKAENGCLYLARHIPNMHMESPPPPPERLRLSFVRGNLRHVDLAVQCWSLSVPNSRYAVSPNWSSVGLAGTRIRLYKGLRRQLQIYCGLCQLNPPYPHSAKQPRRRGPGISIVSLLLVYVLQTMNVRL